MFIDIDGKQSEKESPTACAAANGAQFFVKLKDGFLYNPMDIFADKSDLLAIDTFKGKKIVDWGHVSEEVFRLYVSSLVNRSKPDLSRAQALFDNTQKVQRVQKFVRSGK